MKTAVWLYLFLFVAFFDLHAQYPMLTPFAVSLGAAPSFIGLVMGMYSLTHLPGNLIAGIAVDRFGSRFFIAVSLVGAGILLLFQARVTDPWQLLYIRSISGFVLAFLSPACMSMLARLAKDHIHQGKLMAGNGLVHTIASVVSPAAGAYLAASIGFKQSFSVLGWVLLLTGFLSLWFVKEPARTPEEIAEFKKKPAPKLKPTETTEANVPKGFPWAIFSLPVGMACAQGILAFELPLRGNDAATIMSTGILFSVVSLGALVTLGLLFLNRYLPYNRTIIGVSLLAVCYYGLASGWPIPLLGLLFVIGMAKGVIFPAMTSFLLQLSGPTRYGRTFSILSISLSIGSFLGPVAAGAVRDHFSPYFLSFLALMISLALLFPRASYRANWNPRASIPPASGH
ncbi:MFS transporter [Cohnella lupini]|uniref:Putative MFS family arabinose efflux permease n=1 Tax=Cohnella lupini TaxID=1294267 RepID=A0A3D9I629_9BACL|nr:MFS transporter [Cohnella lupini]RED57212.1 putative MFS family arabinose efflux permease [Cohnella lupini]